MFYAVCCRNVCLGIYASMEDARKSVLNQFEGSVVVVHERSDSHDLLEVGDEFVTITANVLSFAPTPLFRS
jgi:hypothetical protein